MNKLTTIIAAAAVLFLAAGAAAQNDDEAYFQAGVKGGWFFWSDDPLSDYVENNWAIGGELKFWMSNNIGLGAEIQWTSKESDVQVDPVVDVTLDYTQIPINLNAYYRIPMNDGKSSFYIGGGASIVFADATLSAQVEGLNVSLSADDTVFGFNGVAGYEFGMFFVEAQWLWAEATFLFDDDDLDVEDNQIGGPSFWVGVRF